MDFLGADTAQLLEQARALRTGDQRVTAVREALHGGAEAVPTRGVETR
jgi:hypothetical protein